jgi:uncharacterized surface protein with fasciclin (FAS1) repeats
MSVFRPTRFGLGLAAAAVLASIGLAGCTSEETPAAQTAGTAGAPSPSSPAAATGNEPVGPACDTLPTSGPGSLQSLADQPVASAAAQSPALSTLVTAVTEAGLLDTLNSTPDITVFAPTNDAFAKIPQDTLNQVLADKQALTNLLTYHVVEQRRAPAELDMGTLPTLQGSAIRTAKSGDTYTVNDARVLCGNVQTTNATVYLVDTVLMPAT